MSNAVRRSKAVISRYYQHHSVFFDKYPVYSGFNWITQKTAVSISGTNPFFDLTVVSVKKLKINFREVLMEIFDYIGQPIYCDTWKNTYTYESGLNAAYFIGNTQKLVIIGAKRLNQREQPAPFRCQLYSCLRPHKKLKPQLFFKRRQHMTRSWLRVSKPHSCIRKTAALYYFQKYLVFRYHHCTIHSTLEYIT